MPILVDSTTLIKKFCNIHVEKECVTQIPVVIGFEFIIDKKGNVANIHFLQASGNCAIDSVIVDILAKTKWIPGVLGDSTVNVIMREQLYIDFQE